MTNPRPTILFVVHAGGGGTIRFARELAELISDRVDVVWAWGVENNWLHISSRPPYEPERSFDLGGGGLGAALSALQSFRLSRVNVIQTMGLESHIAALIDRLAVPYDVTFTDYHHFSAMPHFEGSDGRFIGDAALATISQGRRGIAPLLRHAERRIAICQDLAHRIGMFLPGLSVMPVQVVEPDTSTMPVKVQALAESETMRVLALGRLSPVKGLATIVAVARRAERENFPIEITSLGETYPEATEILRAAPRVRMLGGYEQKDLAAIVSRLDPHLAWFPFNTPETHSYALSDVMRLGLPVLATGIGAIPERVKGRPSTWVVPFEDADDDHFFNWLRRLYSERMQTPAVCPSVDHLPPVVKNFYPDRYLGPLLDAGIGPRLRAALSSLRMRRRGGA